MRRAKRVDETNQGIPTGFFLYTFSMDSLALCQKQPPYPAPKKTRDSQFVAGNAENRETTLLALCMELPNMQTVKKPSYLIQIKYQSQWMVKWKQGMRGLSHFHLSQWVRNILLYENYQHLIELQLPSFFLDIENLTEVYERTSNVASVPLSKGTEEKSNFSLALSVNCKGWRD